MMVINSLILFNIRVWENRVQYVSDNRYGALTKRATCYSVHFPDWICICWWLVFLSARIVLKRKKYLVDHSHKPQTYHHLIIWIYYFCWWQHCLMRNLLLHLFKRTCCRIKALNSGVVHKWCHILKQGRLLKIFQSNF